MRDRIEFFDLAKGVAILAMVQIHLMEVFALPAVYNSLLGKISLFLGGPLVAPAFLLILGYFLAPQKHTLSNKFFRGVKLFIIGLLLNLGLNLNLLVKNYKGIVNINKWQFLLGVDILLCAGLSIIILAMVSAVFKKNVSLYLMFSCLIVFATKYITALPNLDSFFKYPMAFVGGKYIWSYFPLFPWLAYPFVGYALFLLKDRVDIQNLCNPRIRLIGIIVITTIINWSGIYAMPQITKLAAYYHHGLSLFLWINAFLFIWFLFLKTLGEHIEQSQMFSYVKWLGSNVTTIYIIQWLIIGNIGTSIYKTQTLAQLIIWYVFIMILVSICTFSFLKCKQAWRLNS